MKLVRVLLQVVIVAIGVVAILSVISRPAPDWVGVLGLGAFFAILLALTFMLKEETDDRLIPFHQVSTKPIGVVMLLLGLFGIYTGVNYLLGAESLPDSEGRCRAVCGLILLVSEGFGVVVGKYFAFTLWTSLGVFIAFAGFKALGSRRS